MLKTLLFVVLCWRFSPSAGLITGYHESACDTVDSTRVEHVLPICFAIFSEGTFKGTIIQSTPASAVPVFGCERPRAFGESTSFSVRISKEDCIKSHDNQTSLDYLYGYVRSSRMQLTKYSAKVDVAQNLIIVKDGLVCDFDKYECEDGYDRYFWFPLPQQCDQFQSIVSGDFEVIYNHEYKSVSYVVTSTEDAAIVFKLTEETKLCSTVGFKTETPGVYFVPGANVFRVADVDLNEWISSSGVYSEPNLSSRATDVVKRRCEGRRDFFHEKLYSMIHSPKENPYLEFSPGFIGVVENFMFHLKKCRKIQLSSRDVPGKCFRDIPVRDGAGREFYVRRHSRMVVSKSRVVPCKTGYQKLWEFIDQLSSFALTLGLIHNGIWALAVVFRGLRVLAQKILRKFDLPVPRFVSIEIKRPENQGPVGAMLPAIMAPPFFQM